jgi:TonB-linked SusC/RagA family outer membrane protein
MKTKFNGILTLLIALSVQFIFAQKTVSGTVSDENGALPGVNVVIKGTQTGTETDFDGKYSIVAKKGDVLQFSYVGMETALVTVGDATNYDVKLEAAASNILDEIVLIGYGTQKRSEVTSSISKINANETANIVAPSFETQIAGKATGVQITNSTGVIGEVPRFRIRGISSINSGTYPLIIIDGMPVYSGDLGGYANTNALADLNPADIESFEILKDGAATAIYGSRAANGVLLVTTKKGKKGTMKISFNNSIGFANPIKTFDLLETPDFLTISNEKRTNRGQAPWAIGSDFNTDWQAAVLNNNAIQLDHNLSLNGGGDKTTYFLSLGYTDQDGTAKANDMNRLSMRTNLEHSIFSWLKVGGGLSITRTQYNGLNTGRNSLSGNMFNAIRQLPNTPIYNPAHPTGYNISGANVGQWDNTDPVGDNITNIAYVLENNRYYSKVNRTLANAFVSADLLKGLNFRFQASADNPLSNGFLYWSPIHGDGSGSNGRLQNDNNDLMRWNVQNVLNYNKTFASDHNLGLTAVVEYQKEKNQYFYGIGTNLLDEFYNQNLVTGSYAVQESGGSVTEIGLVSYVGRATYNYKSKYFLQASLRRDGISKLHPDTRWNNFTGFSMGWNISKETFFASLNEYINEFKVRGSFSEVGNTEIGTYPYFSLTTASPYSGENGIAFSQFGNDELLWETSAKTDFGLDLSFLENKIKFNFDYFKNDINGLILAVPVAPSLGIPNNRINKNIGDMYNKGYEFALNVEALEKGALKWTVSTNLTLSENKVTAIPDSQDIIGGTSTDVNINPNIIIREGESINALYGYEYWGVNPANGNPVYYKADGTLVQGNLPTSTYFVFDPADPSNLATASSLTTADKVILGSSLPTYYGAFSNKLSYKNFDLNIFFRFSGGNKIFNSTRRELMNQNFNNNSTEILGRWQSATEPGDGWTPRLWASSNTFTNLSGHASSRFLEDGDFISMDNVSLGYKFPKSLTDKVKVENIRFYVQAQNLWIITKYTGLNPEMETSGVDLNGTPRASVWSMGLNINL